MQRALSMPNASLLLASVHLSALTTPACVCGLCVLCCLRRCTKRRVLCCLRRCAKGRVAPCLHLCTKLLASTRYSLACVYACICTKAQAWCHGLAVLVLCAPWWSDLVSAGPWSKPVRELVLVAAGEAADNAVPQICQSVLQEWLCHVIERLAGMSPRGDAAMMAFT